MSMLRELLNEIGEWCQSEEADALCSLMEREAGDRTGVAPTVSKLRALEDYLRSPEAVEESARLDTEAQGNSQEETTAPNPATE